MTIIVYDRVNDVAYCDRQHTISGVGKPRVMSATKVNHGRVDLESPLEYVFCSAGNLEDTAVARYLNGAVKDVLSGRPGVLPFNTDHLRVLVRIAGGSVLTNNSLPDDTSVLCELQRDFDVPFSFGSGGYYFDAYWLEHGDVKLAMELTCMHADGCGFGYDTF